MGIGAGAGIGAAAGVGTIIIMTGRTMGMRIVRAIVGAGIMLGVGCRMGIDFEDGVVSRRGEWDLVFMAWTKDREAQASGGWLRCMRYSFAPYFTTQDNVLFAL